MAILLIDAALAGGCWVAAGAVTTAVAFLGMIYVID
jgi:hypothetical protein